MLPTYLPKKKGGRDADTYAAAPTQEDIRLVRNC